MRNLRREIQRRARKDGITFQEAADLLVEETREHVTELSHAISEIERVRLQVEAHLRELEDAETRPRSHGG